VTRAVVAWVIAIAKTEKVRLATNAVLRLATQASEDCGGARKLGGGAKDES
jgi:hypothetical protein